MSRIPEPRPFDADDWEYHPLRLPPDVSRLTASVQLAIQAEYGGWELSRLLLYPDGRRKVWLRRRIIRVARTFSDRTG